MTNRLAWQRAERTRQRGSAGRQNRGGVPTTNTGVGRIPNSGIDISHETMIETAIAKPCARQDRIWRQSPRAQKPRPAFQRR